MILKNGLWTQRDLGSFTCFSLATLPVIPTSYYWLFLHQETQHTHSYNEHTTNFGENEETYMFRMEGIYKY